MGDFIIITTTTDSKEEAEKLAALMTEKRLCACAQVEGPIRSFYWWQDEIQNDEEWRCLFKTRAACFSEFEETLTANHSYDVPQLVAVPITWVGKAYASWLDKEIK